MHRRESKARRCLYSWEVRSVNIFLLARATMPESPSPPVEPVATRYKYRFCIETTSACPDPIRPADPGRRRAFAYHIPRTVANFTFFAVPRDKRIKKGVSPQCVKKYYIKIELKLNSNFFQNSIS